MSQDIKARAEITDFGSRVGILFKRGTGDRGDPLQFASLAWGEENPDDHYRREPTVVMHVSDAQVLMDSLWSAGLRPTQGKQSEGVTAAQGRHLEDMRAIAFAKLEVVKP